MAISRFMLTDPEIETLTKFLNELPMGTLVELDVSPQNCRILLDILNKLKNLGKS